MFSKQKDVRVCVLFCLLLLCHGQQMSQNENDSVHLLTSSRRGLQQNTRQNSMRQICKREWNLRKLLLRHLAGPATNAPTPPTRLPGPTILPSAAAAVAAYPHQSVGRFRVN